MKLLSELTDFAQAIFEQKEWLLTGSVIVAFLTWAWRKWYGAKSKRISYSLQIAGTLLFATFFAWRHEHELALDRPQFDAKEFHLTQEPLNVANSDLKAYTNYFRLQLANTSERRYARDISGQVVVLGAELDPSKPAVAFQAIGAVNPVGPKRELNVASMPTQFDYSSTLYVYTALHYEDASTGESYNQVWYNKVTSPQGGIFISTLFQVDGDEQKKMANCLAVILHRPAISR